MELRTQIIDAGSSGSRMHVYEWEPREFKVVPPPISMPGSTNQWTHRMEPGISSFSSNPEVNVAGAWRDRVGGVGGGGGGKWRKFCSVSCGLELLVYAAVSC